MTTNPFGTSPPTVPTLADIGLGLLVDDPEYPPIPTEQPTAQQINLHDFCSAVAALMCPPLIVSVVYGSSYTLGGFRATNPNIAAGDITIIPWATGSMSVTVTAGKLPSHGGMLPMAWSHRTGATAAGLYISNGANVTMVNSSGFIDGSFTVAIWGS